MSESTEDTGTQELSVSDALAELDALDAPVDDTDGQTDNEEGDEESLELDPDEVTEEGEVEEPEEEPTETELYEVTVNGVTEKVPLDELKAGYMKDAYFRQETAKVADVKKQLVAERQELTQYENQLADILQEYSNRLAQYDAPPQRADYQDVDQYLQARDLWESVQAERSKAVNARKQLLEQNAQQEGSQFQQWRQAEDERIIQLIPEWSNGEVYKKEANEIFAEFCKAKGLDSQAGLESFKGIAADELSWIRDAIKYRNLVANKKANQGKLKAVPKVVKPSKGVVKTANQNAMARLRQTGSKRDALAALDKLNL